jgi:hypothetical protein
MNTNTVLAVIIVLLFITLFATWVYASVDILATSPGSALNIIVPGAVLFGFWGLVAWRLYTCPSKPARSEVVEDILMGAKFLGETAKQLAPAVREAIQPAASAAAPAVPSSALVPVSST